MTTDILTSSPLAQHRHLARLPSHWGAATLEIGAETYSGMAEFLLPALGQAVAALHTDRSLDADEFGRELLIEAGAFRVEVPVFCVRHQPETPPGSARWVLLSPVNAPVRVRYGSPRPLKTAVVLLNNFDYRYGDAVTAGGGWTTIGTPFAVDLGSRQLTFRRSATYEQVRPLARAGVQRTASLTECCFGIGPDEGDEECLHFATDIACLITLATGFAASVAMVEYLDEDGVAALRVIPQPVNSGYRDGFRILDDHDLEAFLQVSYPTFVAMRQRHSAWRKLPSYCGSLEDGSYMEQKFASLMMALEFFMRNSLVEHGLTESDTAGLDFAKLVGAVRKHLRWDIPKHYMAKETVRVWRNAVMHGDELPSNDSGEFRRLFDKWRLFLFRRVLMRLGYQGKIQAPHRGCLSSSQVADFSEEFNFYEPADPSKPNPVRELVNRIKEFNSLRDPRS